MNLDKFKLIFLDFDGVIKESVPVKTDAFVELFQSYGDDVCNKVRRHHIENGGMSRYSKIPLYLEWSKIEVTDNIVDEYCEKFSKIVQKKVVNSAWVPGVKSFIKNSQEKELVLVSATPQKELETICNTLNLTYRFSEIYGSPVHKSYAMNTTMLNFNLQSKDCLMIGDSETDFDAAKNSNVHFLLRIHKYNNFLLNSLSVDSIDDFLEI